MLTDSFAWPVVTLVGRGFVVDGRVDTGMFAEVFDQARTWRIAGTTLLLAASGTAVSVALGLPGAYVLYVCRFPGRALVRALVGVQLVLPTVVVGVAFLALLGPSGRAARRPRAAGQSRTAIVLALVFFNYSVVVRTVGTVVPTRSACAAGRPRPGCLTLTVAASPFRRSRPRSPQRPLWFSSSAPAHSASSWCSAGSGSGPSRRESRYQTTQLLDLGAAAALSITQLVVVTLCLVVTNATTARQERALRLRARMPRASSGSLGVATRCPGR